MSKNLGNGTKHQLWLTFCLEKKAKYVFFVLFFAKDGKIWENCKKGRLENGQNTECIWRVPII